MTRTLKTFLASAILFTAGTAAAADYCRLAECGNQGNYSVVNSRDERLSKCDSGRAAHEVLQAMQTEGQCYSESTMPAATMCELSKLAECEGQGGYAVTNSKGQRITKCDTGRAAIDTLKALQAEGVICSK